jgi:hypothetical protein
MRSKSSSELENPKMKLKYGGFYSEYSVHHKYFFLVGNLQNILSSICLASLSGVVWPQIGILMAIRVVFVFLLACIKPYEDMFAGKMNVLISSLKIFQIFLLMLVVSEIAEGAMSVFLILLLLHFSLSSM